MDTFHAPAIEQKDFVNSALFNDLISGKYPHLSYTYTKDDNQHTGDFILSIHSTSLAEIDECEPVLIEEYFYNTRAQMEDDAFQLRLMSCPLFEEI